MVAILDGNSEISAQVLSEIGYLIRLRHFVEIDSSCKFVIIFEKDLSFFIRAQRILSYQLI